MCFCSNGFCCKRTDEIDSGKTFVSSDNEIVVIGELIEHVNFVCAHLNDANSQLIFHNRVLWSIATEAVVYQSTNK